MIALVVLVLCILTVSALVALTAPEFQEAWLDVRTAHVPGAEDVG